jgi:two-component system response regulator MprA
MPASPLRPILDAMPEAAVLLVDDDPRILRMLERTLGAEGYAVSAVPDGGAALASVERSVPDLIVLDVTMPGMDGLAVTRRLRGKRLPVPILLLTARDALEERVAGLDAGADDYLVKPFEVEELTARVRALLRRNHPPGEQLAFADLVIAPEDGTARRGGRELRLTRREMELLALLLRNGRSVVTREQALEEVWGGEGEAGANVVDRYVAYLRRKLGEPALIHTVRGVGFRLAS